MEKNNYTTLISCRIDNKVMAKIDKFREGRRYLNRSGIINQALIRLFNEYGDREIYDFLYNRQPLKI